MSNVCASFCFIILVFAVSANCSKTQLGIYEIRKGDFSVKVTNYGARIISVLLPDKNGKLGDVVLGYDTIKEYENDTSNFGAIVGRVANRISGAKFSLNGKVYKLYANDGNGKNTIHGGRVGLSKVIWKVLKHDESKKLPFITFQYHSHDDEEGFPGNLIITVTYLLHAKSKLQITLHAEAKDDEETPLILAQNIYWNLGGHNSPGNILHDHLRVLASSYRRLDDNLVPTGRTLPVKNTPYDFLQYHPIKSRFRKLRNGYKVDYLLDHRNAKDGVELAAVLRDKKTGRVMKVWTDQALLQFRTGDEVRNVRGKGGVLYQKNSGLVLSAQGYSDSEDEGDFPPLVITKEKPYKQTTVFQFLIKKKK
ncbi:hypothetical protein ACS0TY_028345 [Phlomoides rotata]